MWGKKIARLMRKAAIFAGMLCLLGTVVVKARAGSALEVPDCQPLYAEYADSADGKFSLKNPVLKSEQELAAQLQKVTQLHGCLAQGISNRSEDEQGIFTDSEFFLIFAGGYQSTELTSSLRLIDLATTDDPAIIKLRDEVGTPPPEGYVFVRFYSDRQQLPDLLKPIFADPNIAGVTILTRYIAIPGAVSSTATDQLLWSRSISKTVSHELVHAYVNATLQPERIDQLPLWYHEGLAIYFSGSGETDTIVTPYYTLQITSPADYRQYEVNFKYLEAHLGKENLHRAIYQSLQKADAAILLKDLSIQDASQLAELANAWQQRKVRNQIILISVGLLVSGWMFSRLAPEVECSCGRQGGRKDFASGYCPNCGRRIFMPPSAFRRLFSRVWPVCEVCKKRFWRVSSIAEPIKIWVDHQGGKPLGHPMLIYVRNACPSCQSRSRQLGETRQQQLQTEMQQFYQSAVSFYRQWLLNAPIYPALPIRTEGKAETLELEQAAQAFAQAAFYARYPTETKTEPPFYWTTQGYEDFTDINTKGYKDIIATRSYISGWEIEFIGSIYRLPPDHIVIQWE